MGIPHRMYCNPSISLAHHMKLYLTLVVAVALSVGGCGKKDEPRPVASQPSVTKPEDSKAAVAPTPPLPASDAPKSSEVPLPQPGQANDHSSPAFKGGGVPDKKK
jgi:hypothetical protein